MGIGVRGAMYAAATHLAVMQKTLSMVQKLSLVKHVQDPLFDDWETPLQTAKVPADRYVIDKRSLHGYDVNTLDVVGTERAVYVNYGGTWWECTSKTVRVVPRTDVESAKDVVFIGAESLPSRVTLFAKARSDGPLLAPKVEPVVADTSDLERRIDDLEGELSQHRESVTTTFDSIFEDVDARNEATITRVARLLEDLGGESGKQAPQDLALQVAGFELQVEDIRKRFDEAMETLNRTEEDRRKAMEHQETELRDLVVKATRALEESDPTKVIDRLSSKAQKNEESIGRLFTMLDERANVAKDLDERVKDLESRPVSAPIGDEVGGAQLQVILRKAGTDPEFRESLFKSEFLTPERLVKQGPDVFKNDVYYELWERFLGEEWIDRAKRVQRTLVEKLLDPTEGRLQTIHQPQITVLRRRLDEENAVREWKDVMKMFDAGLDPRYAPIAMRIAVIERPNGVPSYAEELRTLRTKITLLLTGGTANQRATEILDDLASAIDQKKIDQRVRVKSRTSQRLEKELPDDIERLVAGEEMFTELQKIRKKVHKFLKWYQTLVNLYWPNQRALSRDWGTLTQTYAAEFTKVQKPDGRSRRDPISLAAAIPVMDAIRLGNRERKIGAFRDKKLKIPYQETYFKQEWDARDPTFRGERYAHWMKNDGPSPVCFRVAYPGYEPGDGPETPLGTVSVPGYAVNDTDQYIVSLANFIVQKIKHRSENHDSPFRRHCVVLTGATGTGKTSYWERFVERVFSPGKTFFPEGSGRPPLPITSIRTTAYFLTKQGGVNPSATMVVRHGLQEKNPSVWRRARALTRPGAHRDNTLPKVSDAESADIRDPKSFAFVERPQWTKELGLVDKKEEDANRAEYKTNVLRLSGRGRGASEQQKKYMKFAGYKFDGRGRPILEGHDEYEPIVRDLRDPTMVMNILFDNRMEVIRKMPTHDSTRVHILKTVTFGSDEERNKFVLDVFIMAGAETKPAVPTGPPEQQTKFAENASLHEDYTDLISIMFGKESRGVFKATGIGKCIQRDSPLSGRFPVTEGLNDEPVTLTDPRQRSVYDDEDRKKRFGAVRDIPFTGSSSRKVPTIPSSTVILTTWPTGYEREHGGRNYHRWSKHSTQMMGLYCLAADRDMVFGPAYDDFALTPAFDFNGALWEQVWEIETESRIALADAWKHQRMTRDEMVTSSLAKFQRCTEKAFGVPIDWGRVFGRSRDDEEEEGEVDESGSWYAFV